MPHLPQFLGSEVESASQPFLRSLSQSSWPMLHEELQAPIEQTVVPPTMRGHTAPHAPQLAMSSLAETSQPSESFLLQSRKPALQAPIEQVPPAQRFAALGYWAQTRPQAPQLVTSLVVLRHAPPQQIPPPASLMQSVSMRQAPRHSYLPKPSASTQIMPPPQLSLVGRHATQRPVGTSQRGVGAMQSTSTPHLPHDVGLALQSMRSGMLRTAMSVLFIGSVGVHPPSSKPATSSRSGPRIG